MFERFVRGRPTDDVVIDDPVEPVVVGLESCDFHNGRGLEDISDNETAEKTAEALVIVAEEWDRRMKDMGPRLLELHREDLDESLPAHMQPASRDQKRSHDNHRLAKGIRNGGLAILHNEALDYVQSVIGRDIDERSLRLDHYSYLEEVTPVIIAGVDYLVADETEDDDVRALAYIYMCEQIARSTLYTSHLMQPDVLRSIFNPATFSELPLSLQRLAALDIRRGDKASILLLNARTDEVKDDRTREEIMSDYISNNHLTDSIREHLNSISLGAKAMGSMECSLNQFGLCMKVLARIPGTDLPQPIAQDIQQKAARAKQDRILKLNSLARGVSINKMFDSTTKLHVPQFNSTNSSQSSGKKRLPSIDTNDVRDIEREAGESEPTFSRYVIRSKKQPDVALDAEIKDIQSQAQALLTLPEISEYYAKHKTDTLDSFLVNALLTIIASERYNTTKGAIVPYLSRRADAYANPEGIKEKFSRLSGAQLSGGGGGTIGRHTRIIFSQGTENGVRHVTIHKIDTKSNMISNDSIGQI